MASEIVTIDPNHSSFSSIKEHMSCPRSWYAKRIMGKKGVAGEAAQFGNLFEAEVTTAIGAILEPKFEKLESKSNPAAMFDDVLASGGLVGQKLVEQAMDKQMQEVKKAANVYLTSSGAWTKDTPGKIYAQRRVYITPEQWGMLEDMYDCHPYGITLPLLGYIDLLLIDDYTRKICDLKTSTRKGCDPLWLLQTGLYSLAERAQEIEIHLTIRPQCRSENPRKPPQYRTAFYKWRTTDDFYRWVITTIGYQMQLMKISAQSSLNKLPAIAGYWCDWCSEKIGCEGFMLKGINVSGGTEGGSSGDD